MTKKAKEQEDTIGITEPKSNLPDWYSQVVQKAKLADYAPIAGCMVIRPYGFAIWEKIKEFFDEKILSTGHRNAYFPLFIPESFLLKEAKHFVGFTPEVAWIHTDSKPDFFCKKCNNKVKKEDEKCTKCRGDLTTNRYAKLDWPSNIERYALRPTSETIIYDSYSKWIRSWRDLPLLINQWCNVVRWETKATKLFLRTREFLWQEGHTVHATKDDGDKEVMMILEFYRQVMEELLAVPVIPGLKSESEKFAGAFYTTTLESLMPDGKALQMGTSHNLGQNFAKAFDIKFKDKDEREKLPWQTSWGISTRLLGSVIMAHGDDKGLILPPRVAPIQVVIVPIYFDKNKKKVINEARKIKKTLYNSFRVELDDRDGYNPGYKFNDWEMRGVPLRLEIGPKDIEKKQVIAVRRDIGVKTPIKIKILEKELSKLIENIQKDVFKKAKKAITENTAKAKDFKEFEVAIKQRKMIFAPWCGEISCEEEIKEKTAATVRMIPFKSGTKYVKNPEKNIKTASGKCVHCKKKAKYYAYFARAY